MSNENSVASIHAIDMDIFTYLHEYNTKKNTFFCITHMR